MRGRSAVRSVEMHARLHGRMRAVTDRLRLPLRSGQWRGATGSVLGLGTGSSIEFQDQRPYLPGDDLRHINWQATARTGQATMKLFRQEVTPRVDVVVDGSGSMFLTAAKAERVWEMVYFCLESGLRLGGALRIHVLGAEVVEMPVERALSYGWEVEEGVAMDLAEALVQVPFRQGSLRVVISDLLTPSPAERVLPLLSVGQGRPLLLAPYCGEEATPDWAGNVEFEESEGGGRSRRRVEGEGMRRYLRAYATHFQMWRETASRHGAVVAQVAAEGDFLGAMEAEALRVGAVEAGS